MHFSLRICIGDNKQGSDVAGKKHSRNAGSVLICILWGRWWSVELVVRGVILNRFYDFQETTKPSSYCLANLMNIESLGQCRESLVSLITLVFKQPAIQACSKLDTFPIVVLQQETHNRLQQPPYALIHRFQVFFKNLRQITDSSLLPAINSHNPTCKACNKIESIHGGRQKGKSEN